MYLSHPVRRMREDPAGEQVVLRITAADDDARDRLAEKIAAVGTVEDRLRFGGLRVTVDQDRLDEVCSFEGIDAVETANTFTIDADGAAEDVEYDSTCR
jgi:hypothetical protein